jgi:hypothetical protein
MGGLIQVLCVNQQLGAGLHHEGTAARGHLEPSAQPEHNDAQDADPYP